MYFAAHPLAASIGARHNRARKNPVPAVYLAGAGLAALVGYYFYTKSSAEVAEDELMDDDLEDADVDASTDVAVEGEQISVADQDLQDFDVDAAEDASSGDTGGGGKKHKKAAHGKKAHDKKAHGIKSHGKKSHGHKGHGKQQGGSKLQPTPMPGQVKFKPSTPQVRAGTGPGLTIRTPSGI